MQVYLSNNDLVLLLDLITEFQINIQEYGSGRAAEEKIEQLEKVYKKLHKYVSIVR